ncbi:uncharacterized protein LOC115219328 [Octopus sinensis]|uniref:Uncharacterized protein LOC115219328 n=1 Tax=Octopus sinensis TaxID=2607531 RepID=A0A6P7T6E2_9MOLL|nr:uncharacterized protein LOC115219328 [Octopus sinensis]
MLGIGGIKRKQGSGVNIKQDNAFLKSLKAKISEDPTTLMRKLSMDMKVDPKNIRNAVHTDLHLESYVRTMRHLLTHAMKSKRHERTKNVWRYMKHNQQTVKIFSDENIFTVDAILKRRNDRYIVFSAINLEYIKDGVI